MSFWPIGADKQTREALVAYFNEHVLYERNMLRSATQALAWPQAPGFHTNLLLEGFALHLTNLIGFFYPNVVLTDQDTIRADDFIVGIGSFLYPCSETLRHAVDRFHREMCQLSPDRIAGTTPRKEWDHQALSMEIEELMRNFVKMAGLQ